MDGKISLGIVERKQGQGRFRIEARERSGTRQAEQHWRGGQELREGQAAGVFNKLQKDLYASNTKADLSKARVAAASLPPSRGGGGRELKPTTGASGKKSDGDASDDDESIVSSESASEVRVAGSSLLARLRIAGRDIYNAGTSSTSTTASSSGSRKRASSALPNVSYSSSKASRLTTVSNQAPTRAVSPRKGLTAPLEETAAADAQDDKKAHTRWHKEIDDNRAKFVDVHIKVLVADVFTEYVHSTTKEARDAVTKEAKKSLTTVKSFRSKIVEDENRIKRLRNAPEDLVAKAAQLRGDATHLETVIIGLAENKWHLTKTFSAMEYLHAEGYLPCVVTLLFHGAWTSELVRFENFEQLATAWDTKTVDAYLQHYPLGIRCGNSKNNLVKYSVQDAVDKLGALVKLKKADEDKAKMKVLHLCCGSVTRALSEDAMPPGIYTEISLLGKSLALAADTPEPKSECAKQFVTLQKLVAVADYSGPLYTLTTTAAWAWIKQNVGAVPEVAEENAANALREGKDVRAFLAELTAELNDLKDKYETSAVDDAVCEAFGESMLAALIVVLTGSSTKERQDLKRILQAYNDIVEGNFLAKVDECAVDIVDRFCKDDEANAKKAREALQGKMRPFVMTKIDQLAEDPDVKKQLAACGVLKPAMDAVKDTFHKCMLAEAVVLQAEGLHAKVSKAKQAKSPEEITKAHQATMKAISGFDEAAANAQKNGLLKEAKVKSACNKLKQLFGSDQATATYDATISKFKRPALLFLRSLISFDASDTEDAAGAALKLNVEAMNKMKVKVNQAVRWCPPELKETMVSVVELIFALLPLGQHRQFFHNIDGKAGEELQNIPLHGDAEDLTELLKKAVTFPNLAVSLPMVCDTSDSGYKDNFGTEVVQYISRCHETLRNWIESQVLGHVASLQTLIPELAEFLPDPSDEADDTRFYSWFKPLAARAKKSYDNVKAAKEDMNKYVKMLNMSATEFVVHGQAQDILEQVKCRSVRWAMMSLLQNPAVTQNSKIGETKREKLDETWKEYAGNEKIQEYLSEALKGKINTTLNLEFGCEQNADDKPEASSTKRGSGRGSASSGGKKRKTD